MPVEHLDTDTITRLAGRGAGPVRPCGGRQSRRLHPLGGGVVDGLMTGRFDIDGDMQKVVKYSRAAVRLTETAAGIDAEFAGEGFVDP